MWLMFFGGIKSVKLLFFIHLFWYNYNEGDSSMFDKLNEQQLEAVRHIDGPCLVIA